MRQPVSVPRWLFPALFAGALTAAFWRAPQPAPAAFTAPSPPSSAALAALFTADRLPPTANPAEPSLTLLPDGQIAAAWTADSAADADQRDIRFSVLGRTGWSVPRVIANRESTADGTFAFEQDIGNPLLHAEGGWLHLWYTSRSGWAGRSIKHSQSTNRGLDWSKPTRLPSAPLAGGSLLRSPPLPLADGGLGLAVSSGFFGNQGEYLRWSANGRMVDKQRLAQAGPTWQPAVVALDERRALALLSEAGRSPGHIRTASTDDGGAHWSAGPALPLANPGSPLALLRLNSGRLLLAGNPQNGRQTLALWLSADEGKTWLASRIVEDAADGAADFAEPCLLQGHDGRIHLAYRWRQQAIRHVAFSEAWLASEAP